MTISRVGHGAVSVVSTNTPIPHPTGLAAGDKLVLSATSNGSAIADPAGWTLVASGSGGGLVGKVWEKDHDGGSTTNPVLFTTGPGTKGVAVIEAYRSSTGAALAPLAAEVAADTNTASTAFSVATAAIATAAGDFIAAHPTILAPTGSYTGTASSPTLGQAGSTLGTQVGNYGGRTASNTISYGSYHRPVTAGVSAAITFTATGVGANAAGLAAVFRLREATDVLGSSDVVGPAHTAAAAGDVTVAGAAAAAGPNPISAAAGGLQVAGTVSAAGLAVTVAAAAVAQVTGTAATTGPGHTAAATGTSSTVTGTAAATGPAPTGSGAGSTAISGTSAATGPQPTAAAAGSSRITAVAAVTGPQSTSSGAGSLRITGVGAAAGPGHTTVGTGTVGSTSTGTAAAAGPAPTSAGTGSLFILGAAAAAGPAPTGAGSGGSRITGLGAATGPGPATLAEAVTRIAGSLGAGAPAHIASLTAFVGEPVDLNLIVVPAGPRPWRTADVEKQWAGSGTAARWSGGEP